MVALVAGRAPSSWHAQTVAETIAALASSVDGLTTGEAAARLARLGSNVIPRTAVVAWWRVLLAPFRGVVVWLLVGASVVAAVTSDSADALAIAAVLVLNVGLGFALEMRARRAVEALSQLEPRRASVIRDLSPREVDARDLVPGDVLLLDPGRAVAADARLVDGAELLVDEALFTGESVPVSKRAEAVVPAEAPIAERRTMVYAGTIVAAGAGRAIVVATAGGTELGAIGRLVSATEDRRTPLELRLDVLGRQLVWMALAVGAATGGLAWSRNEHPAEVVEAAIALAVAAVPEGLPAVATIALALAVHRMAARHAVVRRLPSVEALGAVTVLCTDKTGTLTEGAMTVTEVRTGARTYRVSGRGYDPAGRFLLDNAPTPPDDPDLIDALRIASIASRADARPSDAGWIAHGDPTEAALVVAARKAGLERGDLLRDLPPAGEVPFSSERRMMAVFHRERDGRLVAFVKGAPASVLARCDRLRSGGAADWLSGEARRRLCDANAAMALGGLRVLALASGPVARADESALGHLTFAALVGMHDPATPGAARSVAAFREAGIRTVMMTGDQSGTAVAVADAISLRGDGEALDGHTVDALSDDDLRRRLRAVTVLSRVSPAAKLRAVRLLQADGAVVAMIGDGVNDAAALKQADVGVAMGRRGTDAARETADVVLEDDRFETIGTAIEEGRVVFDNIRKFVFYLFSCNLAEILVLLGTSAVGLPLPLSPVQILWINLVTDTVPALALAVEPAAPDVMRRPPRDPREALLSRRFLASIAGHGALIAAATFAVIAWAALHRLPHAQAMTMAFLTLALAQVFHLGTARDEHAVLAPRRVVANVAALGAVGIASALELLPLVEPRLGALLHVTPLGVTEWLVVASATLAPAVIGQVIRLWRHP